MARDIIMVHEETRQIMVDIVREYPSGKIQYDDTTYATPVYHQICADGIAAGTYIRQEFIETVHKLTDGVREVPVTKLRELLQYVQAR